MVKTELRWNKKIRGIEEEVVGCVGPNNGKRGEEVATWRSGTEGYIPQWMDRISLEFVRMGLPDHSTTFKKKNYYILISSIMDTHFV